jgi:methylmalonyl-CoA mutase
MKDKEEKLFSEFPPVASSQWDEVVKADLKGADYDKKLKWKTDENIIVNPYYRAEDTADLAYLTASRPDEYPFVRGGRAAATGWEIVQTITEANPKKANTIAVDSLAKGASVIIFNAANINTVQDVSIILKNIDLAVVGIRFHHAASYVELAKTLLAFLETVPVDKKIFRGAFAFDPISHLLLHTQFEKSRKEDLEQLVILHQLMGNVCPNFQYLTVNGGLLHSCGATIRQEVGYALASANEYLAFATDNGIAIDDILTKISFEFAISSNYFMEIAKLRAARLLWATIANQYQPATKAPMRMKILSKSSTWNKTIFDPYVNMLRITTEGMAAAIGGADQIELDAFDGAYKDADVFSNRIARNTQLVLKEEAYFGKVIDPAAGSYYVENLTNDIAQQAWALFQEVEQQGGMIQCACEGNVKEAIAQSCKKRNMDIATRKIIFIGTNQYPNLEEKMLDKIEKEASETSFRGLQPYRGAMAFEKLRLGTERWAKERERYPKVLLLKIGNVAMRQARAGFITNFFGCAGYEIIDLPAFDTPKQCIDVARNQLSDVVAICSSDEEYATIGVEIANGLSDFPKYIHCVIAGYPTESIDQLIEAGIQDFIHAKLNILETLQRYHAALGM